MFKKHITSLTIALFLSVLNVQAQENYVNGITKQQEQQIDSLFSRWGDASKPGVIMAILNDNKLVYQKSFGSVDIESRQPILKTTKFQLSRMARHFTAFGVLLLESQGKLSLQDDIKKYITQLSNFKGSIRIIDLLNQSDGLYDYNILNVVSGRPFYPKLSHRESMQLLAEQKELNFEPGSDFVDFTTDTGIMLLTEIIQKVSKKSFAAFMKDEVFTPLGMNNTEFVASQNVALTNLATPYLNIEDKFVYSNTYENVYGTTNLFSTLEDLVKWELNMLTPKLGNKTLFEKLNSVITLKNGKELNTSRGQLTLGQQYGHYERGLYSIYYTGGYGGLSLIHI